MSWWLYGIALLVGLAFVHPTIWKRTRFLTTLVHESGHALVGTLTGGQLVGVVVRSDSSGETVTKHYKGFTAALFSRLPTLMAGYPAPAFFGAFGLILALEGHANAGWLVLGLLGLLCLLFARSFFTVLITLPYTLGAVALIPALEIWKMPVEISLFFLVVLSMILLAGSIKDMWRLTALVNLGQAEQSDPGFLAKMTVGEGGVRLWNILLWLATLLSAALGAWVGIVGGERVENLLEAIL